MSGGYFDYNQFYISTIADVIEDVIRDNDSEEFNEYGDRVGWGYHQDVIAEFKKAVTILRQAAVYAQRIDWLLSCDDGEEAFLRRLKEELEVLE